MKAGMKQLATQEEDTPSVLDTLFRCEISQEATEKW
jgi:hypothetical protein